MNKKLSFVFFLTVLFVILVIAGVVIKYEEMAQTFFEDPLNARYVIDGEAIKFVDGKAEKEIVPGSASKFTAQVFEDVVSGDLNSDGKDDSLMILVVQTGGTGTFYYVVAAIGEGEYFYGTNAVLLGDRIEPKEIEIKDELAVIKYLDRKIDEPMSTEPSVEKTKYINFNGNELREIDTGCIYIADFFEHEGEKLCKENLIIVENPLVGEIISSPLFVKGYARGAWFFEGDFPLILTDWDGRIIAEGYATAQDGPEDGFADGASWMTEDFVLFEGKLEFENPEQIGDFSKRGALIFKKDNPSGLPEFDDALEIPVNFGVE